MRGRRLPALPVEVAVKRLSAKRPCRLLDRLSRKPAVPQATQPPIHAFFTAPRRWHHAAAGAISSEATDLQPLEARRTATANSHEHEEDQPGHLRSLRRVSRRNGHFPRRLAGPGPAAGGRPARSSGRRPAAAGRGRRPQGKRPAGRRVLRPARTNPGRVPGRPAEQRTGTDPDDRPATAGRRGSRRRAGHRRVVHGRPGA